MGRGTPCPSRHSDSNPESKDQIMSKPAALYQCHRCARTGQHNILTAGRRGPGAYSKTSGSIEKLAHFDRERSFLSAECMRKDGGAHGTFTTTHDITRYTKAAIFSRIGKADAHVRSLFDGRRGARRIRMRSAISVGLHSSSIPMTENWDIVGNNTPVFFFRDPLRFSDLNHAIKRDPRTGLRSAQNNWILDSSSRGAPSGHHRHVRPWNSKVLPPDAWFRKAIPSL